MTSEYSLSFYRLNTPLRSARSGLIIICVVMDFKMFWKIMLTFAHVNRLYTYVKKVGFNQLILSKKKHMLFAQVTFGNTPQWGSIVTFMKKWNVPKKSYMYFYTKYTLYRIRKYKIYMNNKFLIDRICC